MVLVLPPFSFALEEVREAICMLFALQVETLQACFTCWLFVLIVVTATGGCLVDSYRRARGTMLLV